MGLGQNIMIMSLILSIFLFLGGVRVVNNDFLSAFFNTQTQSPTLSNGVSTQLDGLQPVSTNIQANVVGTTSFGFIDGLNLVFGFLTIILNVLGAELSLLSVAGMPLAFIFLIAVPIVFIKILAVMTFVRGIIW